MDWYFWRRSGKWTGISTTRVGYDSNDVETDDSSLVVKYVYTTKATRRFTGQSFNQIIATVSDSSATVDANPPHVLSSAPLQGKYQITCTDFNGNEFTTGDIGYGTWMEGIDYTIHNYMPFLTFRTRTRSTGEHGYFENGVSFVIIMEGIEANLPLCSLSDGSTPITGLDPYFEVTEIQSYGVNRFWESIPLEFLVADGQAPSVEVTVDGIEAVCPALNCEYSYVENAG